MASTLVTIRSGARLRRLLADARMTYAELASQVGVHTSRIGQLVDDSFPNIAAITAAAIEDVLSLRRGDLFRPLDDASLYGETADGEGTDGIV